MWHYQGTPSGLYLAHFRTKGSKNGQRLYQYPNGSLTPLGREHYGVGPPRRSSSRLSNFSHTSKDITIGNTPAKQHVWKDADGNNVARFNTFEWWDGTNIEDLKIYDKYKGNRYSYDLLDYATKTLGVKNLAVRKDNSIAKHVYDKYGFKVTQEDDDYYYMSIKR